MDREYEVFQCEDSRCPNTPTKRKSSGRCDEVVVLGQAGGGEGGQQDGC